MKTSSAFTLDGHSCCLNRCKRSVAAHGAQAGACDEAAAAVIAEGLAKLLLHQQLAGEKPQQGSAALPLQDSEASKAGAHGIPSCTLSICMPSLHALNPRCALLVTPKHR